MDAADRSSADDREVVGGEPELDVNEQRDSDARTDVESTTGQAADERDEQTGGSPPSADGEQRTDLAPDEAERLETFVRANDGPSAR